MVHDDPLYKPITYINQLIIKTYYLLLLIYDLVHIRALKIMVLRTIKLDLLF